MEATEKVEVDGGSGNKKWEQQEVEVTGVSKLTVDGGSKNKK